MENGTIILLAYRKPEKRPKGIKAFLEDLVKRIICHTTKSRFHHCLIHLDDNNYEFTIPMGSNKTNTIFVNDQDTLIRESIVPITESQLMFGLAYWKNALDQNYRYNILKLAALMFIYPFRYLFDKIGWAPFSDNHLFGAVCSVGLAECTEAMGLDWLPGRLAETVAPGEYENCKALKDTK